MARSAPEGATVRAVALNDYESIIPLADFERYQVLLATRIDGEQLRVRDKGPIWIVYPWSDHPELDDETTRRKSVWQLRPCTCGEDAVLRRGWFRRYGLLAAASLLFTGLSRPQLPEAAAAA